MSILSKLIGLKVERHGPPESIKVSEGSEPLFPTLTAKDFIAMGVANNWDFARNIAGAQPGAQLHLQVYLELEMPTTTAQAILNEVLAEMAAPAKDLS